MGRQKYYWYSIARIMVMQYPSIVCKANITDQEERFCRAVEKTLAETLQLQDGKARCRAVKEVLFDKTKTYEGVAQELHYNWRTIQNWVNAFVNQVGRNAGF